MSRLLLVLLALLLAGIAGVFWFGEVERRGAELAVATEPSTEAHDESTEAHDEAVELRAPERVSAESALDGDNASQRTSPVDARPHIAGHVRPVAGCAPAAAKVVATVFMSNGLPASYLSANVMRDGSFTLSVPDDSSYALLEVQGERLDRTPSVRALPGELDVLLTPPCLATIHGRVLAPPLDPDANLGSVHLSCTVAGLSKRDDDAEAQVGDAHDDPSAPASAARFIGLDFAQRGVDPVRVGTDGEFELASLPVGLELELGADNPFGPDWHQRLAPLLPGERRELAIALDSGLLITGTVLDEHGAPVAGVTVTVRDSAERDGGHVDHANTEFASDHSPAVDTDANGHFAFGRLARRVWKVTVSDDNLVAPVEQTVDGNAGDARDLVLSVVRGGCVAGTVVWADGTAAKEFDVALDAPSASKWDSCSAGRFELCGVAEDTYDLEVTAERTGVRGKAHLSGVHPGQADLRLVLAAEAVLQLSGTVVDSEGQAIEKGYAFAFDGEHAESDSVADGRFDIDGLTAGQWEIEITAKGFQSATQDVVVGPKTAPLSFVLRDAGRVRGTVVDARGRPVAKATVKAETELGLDDGVDVRTDGEGRFELDAASTSLFVHAICAGYGASESLELAVGSGRTRDGVLLRLREACRLTGRVLDAEGRAVERAHVFVTGASSDVVKSDARGEFTFEDLAPGKVQVSARLEANGASLRAPAELVGGRTTTIELRFEREDPVRIRGRITRGGNALAVPLWFVSNGGDADARSGDDGSFEVTLPRPGAWKCAVWLGAEATQPHPDDVFVLDFVVPDVENHELALDVDAMRHATSFEEISY